MDDRILLSHGDGGKRTRNLINGLILKHLRSEPLLPLYDSALIGTFEEPVAFTTDSYVVSPPFFPGGDIGKLSVCGTVNDLAVCGAKPVAISLSLILEEGFSLGKLEEVILSIKKTSEEAGVTVACGDTKVVERGKGDGIFITTSGVGEVINGWCPSPGSISPGDTVILTGPLGEHGISILVARENLKVRSPILSDVAPLSKMLNGAVEEFGGKIAFMRDPTRGGFGVALNEIAEKVAGRFVIHESEIPVSEEVRGVSEILGFDPIYLANEGKALLIVKKDVSSDVLSFLRRFDEGARATIVGEVTEGRGVVLKTKIGGTRALDYPVGEQLPRIC